MCSCHRKGNSIHKHSQLLIPIPILQHLCQTQDFDPNSVTIVSPWIAWKSIQNILHHAKSHYVKLWYTCIVDLVFLSYKILLQQHNNGKIKATQPKRGKKSYRTRRDGRIRIVIIQEKMDICVLCVCLQRFGHIKDDRESSTVDIRP